MSNSFIQSVSYAKLAKYDQTRTELPIRKYVLISNLLREEEQQQQQQQQQQQHYSDMITDNDEEQDMLLLEKHWFEACLNELDNEEEEEETEGVQEQNSLKRQSDVQLHAIYNISNGRGIFVCCTTTS
jgi:hypothetical protein